MKNTIFSTLLSLICTVNVSYANSISVEEQLLGNTILDSFESVPVRYLAPCVSIKCGTNHGLAQAFIEFEAAPRTKVNSPISGVVVDTIRYKRPYGAGGGPYKTITIQSDSASEGQPQFVKLSNISIAFVTVGEKVNAGCLIGLTSKKKNRNLRVQYSYHQAMQVAYPLSGSEAKEKGFVNPIEVLSLANSGDAQSDSCKPKLAAN